MTENKYYQPKIEEFFVGFEFELNDKKLNNPSTYCEITKKFKDNWIKVKYDGKGIDNLQGFHYNTHLVDVDISRFRVKILDEQDILDCGFVFDSKDNLGNFYYEFNSFVLTFFPPNPTFIEIDNSEPNFTKFIGKIKNKSELIKLLQQLEIPQNN